jgi:hypothetical protein
MELGLEEKGQKQEEKKEIANKIAQKPFRKRLIKQGYQRCPKREPILRFTGRKKGNCK